MSTWHLEPIDIHATWKTIFDQIQANFDETVAQILAQQSTLYIEQFQGDEQKNDFTLTHEVDDDTSVILFRNDKLYGQGKASPVHAIVGNTLHIVDDLDIDEWIQVQYIQANYLVDATNYFFERFEQVVHDWEGQLDDAEKLIQGMESLKNWINTKSDTYLQIIGNTNISAYGDGTLTGALKYMIELWEGGAYMFTPEQIDAVNRMVDWNAATDEEVRAMMEEILSGYTTESEEYMQACIETCAKYAKQAEEAKKAAAAAAKIAEQMAAIDYGNKLTYSGDKLRLQKGNKVLSTVTISGGGGGTGYPNSVLFGNTEAHYIADSPDLEWYESSAGVDVFTGAQIEAISSGVLDEDPVNCFGNPASHPVTFNRNLEQVLNITIDDYNTKGYYYLKEAKLDDFLKMVFDDLDTTHAYSTLRANTGIDGGSCQALGLLVRDGVVPDSWTDDDMMTATAGEYFAAVRTNIADMARSVGDSQLQVARLFFCGDSNNLNVKPRFNAAENNISVFIPVSSSPISVEDLQSLGISTASIEGSILITDNTDESIVHKEWLDKVVEIDSALIMENDGLYGFLVEFLSGELSVNTEDYDTNRYSLIWNNFVTFLDGEGNTKDTTTCIDSLENLTDANEWFSCSSQLSIKARLNKDFMNFFKVSGTQAISSDMSVGTFLVLNSDYTPTDVKYFGTTDTIDAGTMWVRQCSNDDASSTKPAYLPIASEGGGGTTDGIVWKGSLDKTQIQDATLPKNTVFTVLDDYTGLNARLFGSTSVDRGTMWVKVRQIDDASGLPVYEKFYADDRNVTLWRGSVVDPEAVDIPRGSIIRVPADYTPTSNIFFGNINEQKADSLWVKVRDIDDAAQSTPCYVSFDSKVYEDEVMRWIGERSKSQVIDSDNIEIGQVFRLSEKYDGTDDKYFGGFADKGTLWRKVCDYTNATSTDPVYEYVGDSRSFMTWGGEYNAADAIDDVDDIALNTVIRVHEKYNEGTFYLDVKNASASITGASGFDLSQESPTIDKDLKYFGKVMADGDSLWIKVREVADATSTEPVFDLVYDYDVDLTPFATVEELTHTNNNVAAIVDSLGMFAKSTEVEILSKAIDQNMVEINIKTDYLEDMDNNLKLRITNAEKEIADIRSNPPKPIESIADIDDIDVNKSTLDNGDILVYNSTTEKWENQVSSSGVTALVDLTDVSINSTILSDGDTVTYDSTSSKWVNRHGDSFWSLHDTGSHTGTLSPTFTAMLERAPEHMSITMDNYWHYRYGGNQGGLQYFVHDYYESYPTDKFSTKVLICNSYAGTWELKSFEEKTIDIWDEHGVLDPTDSDYEDFCDTPRGFAVALVDCILRLDADDYADYPTWSGSVYNSDTHCTEVVTFTYDPDHYEYWVRRVTAYSKFDLYSDSGELDPTDSDENAFLSSPYGYEVNYNGYILRPTSNRGNTIHTFQGNYVDSSDKVYIAIMTLDTDTYKYKVTLIPIDIADRVTTLEDLVGTMTELLTRLQSGGGV